MSRLLMRFDENKITQFTHYMRVSLALVILTLDVSPILPCC
jgi:hypothetical protein